VPSSLDPGLCLWVALAVAVVMSGFFGVSRRRYLAMPNLPALQTSEIPDCMVVIPARNEEAFIARAVRSLPPDTVIVVDDHSEDATAAAARQAGAGVLCAPDLPDGVVGKPNACLFGAGVLTSKWMLFADADTWFEPGFLKSAVGYAEAGGLAMLSLRLRPEYKTWAERVLGPYAAALHFCGVSPSRHATAAFNGQCVLVHREPYEFLGGHAALLNTMADDVKLAALAMQHRLKFSTARAEKLGHARFRDPGATFRRSAFRFLLLSPWIGIAIAAAALASALWLPALAWLVANREWVAAGVFALLPSMLTLGWYGNAGRALLAPIAIYAMLLILLRGLAGAVAGRRVTWKGRTI
jgi:hypothetical protein